MLCRGSTVATHSIDHLYQYSCTQVSESSRVVSIDFAKNEAIVAVGGNEERQKLTPGTSGFAVCTWSDGSTYQSTVANLMLEVRKAPLKKIKKRPAAAKKKPAAAVVEEEEEDEEEEEEEEEEQEDEEEEEEEELEEAEEEEEDVPAAKKAKKADEEEKKEEEEELL